MLKKLWYLFFIFPFPVSHRSPLVMRLARSWGWVVFSQGGHRRAFCPVDLARGELAICPFASLIIRINLYRKLRLHKRYHVEKEAERGGEWRMGGIAIFTHPALRTPLVLGGNIIVARPAPGTLRSPVPAHLAFR